MQSYKAHVRLAHNPVLAPTILTRRHTEPSLAHTRHHQEHPGCGHEREPGHQGRWRYRRAARPKASTLRQPHQTGRRRQRRIRSSPGQSQGGPQEPRQAHTVGGRPRVAPQNVGPVVDPSFRVGVSGHDQAPSGKEERVGARTAQSIASYCVRLELFLPMQICDEVRFCRLDKTHTADVKRVTLNIVDPEKRQLVLEAFSQLEAEWQVRSRSSRSRSSHSREARACRIHPRGSDSS